MGKYPNQHKELIEGSKNGNRLDQKEIYGLYVDAMYNHSFNMIGNEADAEDVLQESFVLAFKNLNQFNYDSSFGAWLKRIVTNQCLNLLRKNKIRYVEMKDSTIEILDENPQKENVHWDIEKIKQAMTKLSKGYRQVISLYLVEGYDHEEIADILNIAVGTSRSQYLRAKKKLIQIYNEG